MEINDIKEGQTIYYFSVRKFAGRIWEINKTRIKIIKINGHSIRIDRVDDNNGDGNIFTMKNKKFEEYLENCSIKEKIIMDEWTIALKKFSESAKEKLKGYTKLHPNYKWFVYTAEILNDFYELLKNGYTEKGYNKIKKKHSEFENTLMKKIFS